MRVQTDALRATAQSCDWSAEPILIHLAVGDSRVMGMDRVAGKLILLWGWRRALAAFLAGALAVLAQAPFDFFAVCFVSFPVLVWLLDGAIVAAPVPFCEAARPGLRDRLVVRIRLFRRRPLVGGRRTAGRGGELCLGAAARHLWRCRRYLRFFSVWRPPWPGCSGATVSGGSLRWRSGSVAPNGSARCF